MQRLYTNLVKNSLPLLEKDLIEQLKTMGLLIKTDTVKFSFEQLYNFLKQLKVEFENAYELS